MKIMNLKIKVHKVFKMMKKSIIINTDHKKRKLKLHSFFRLITNKIYKKYNMTI